MTSRKWFSTVLITLVVVAILAAGGYALYRYGYSRGAMATPRGEEFMFHDFEDMPFPRGHMGELPQRFQDRSEVPFQRLDPRAALFEHMLPTRSIFSPFSLVLRVLFLGLIVWLLYKFISLFTVGKSWQLSFNSQADVEPEEEVKEKGRGKSK